MLKIRWENFSVFISGRSFFLTWCRRNFYFENFILQGNELKSFYDARQTADEKFSWNRHMAAKMKGKIRKENKIWIAEDTKQTKRENKCKFCAFYGSDVKPYAAEKSDGKKESVFSRCQKKEYTKNWIGYANFKIVYMILRWKQAVFVFYFCIIFQEIAMTSLTAGVLQKILKYAVVFLYTKYQNPAKCL